MSKQPTKGELMPLEGPDRHNGRKHPAITKIKNDAPETKGAHKAAVARQEELRNRS